MLTILTPTYNRAYILHKAYESLCRQSCFDFEWIIVDDGSTDNTEEICKNWANSEENFSITYLKQKNGGKHRAVNHGVSVSRGDYILILDSDDYLTDTAVETVLYWTNTITDKNNIVGVVGLRGHENGTALGERLPSEYLDITSLQRKTYKLMSDKAEAYSKSIMEKYPFPEFEGENFLRESASWDRIARDGYKLRYFNDIIYICEYIEDGLTQNTNADTYAKNFQGYTYCSRLYLDTRSWIYSLNKCGDFYFVAKRKNIKLRDAAKILEVNTVFFGIGILFFVVKKYLKKLVCFRR